MYICKLQLPQYVPLLLTLLYSSILVCSLTQSLYYREGDFTRSSTEVSGDQASDTPQRTEESGLELEICEVPESEEDSHSHTPDALVLKKLSLTGLTKSYYAICAQC